MAVQDKMKETLERIAAKCIEKNATLRKHMGDKSVCFCIPEEENFCQYQGGVIYKDFKSYKECLYTRK